MKISRNASNLRQENDRGKYFGCFVYNDFNLGKVALIWNHSGRDQSDSDGWEPKVIDKINNVDKSRLMEFLRKQKGIDQYLFASESISDLEL